MLPFLQKNLNLINPTEASFFRIAMLSILLLFPFIMSAQVIRKSRVNFESEDGLLITADNYFSKKNNPYIILFHQEGSSRGEFDSIAERFVKMNYNCLAVDLRSGNNYGFVVNETAVRAKEKGINTRLYESLKDIRASVEYIRNKSSNPIILLGSSFSSSLSLIAGKEEPVVKALIAFSPGEFFLPEITLGNVLQNYNKPVFAAFSTTEFPFVEDAFKEADSELITVFKPISGPGKRTAEAMLSSSEDSNEYWLALLIFFRSIR